MSSDSKQKIMEATYAALCKNGYADLSIQKIADEFDKGKSLIYYHFDDKEELMLAFLDHMAEQIKQGQLELEELTPEERLDQLLDLALGIDNDEQWEFRKAFLEIRAQTPQKPDFIEKFEQVDSLIVDNFTQTLEELNAERPETTANILVSCIEGSVIRKVSTGDREGLKELKNSIKGIAEQHIVEGCENR